MDNTFSQLKLNQNYHDKRREMAGNHTESLTTNVTMQIEFKKL